ncbi:hypothetical protein [Bradyrhizobium sp. S3.9.1]|uniref:hypothetical protein n=1 Tax=Bradyrhizobium sp. S3.9.1 TaxID=3156431 RepID=UPI003398D117
MIATATGDDRLQLVQMRNRGGVVGWKKLRTWCFTLERGLCGVFIAKICHNTASPLAGPEFEYALRIQWSKFYTPRLWLESAGNSASGGADARPRAIRTTTTAVVRLRPLLVTFCDRVPEM